ncbi:MAG TPA: 2-phospho-L-lactate transferase [Candidatus Dormibacteraeota bacterium]|nr:2-phospho-L-lactate transferase [Candidatus Dormibacteraeota bacterium]
MLLAGGTGGAKLAVGLQTVLPPGHLTVVANTADDDEFWGLLVCPDVDAVLYRLAGIFNEKAGYGVSGDTFHVLEALSRVGEDTWFRIGDRDIATHLLRDDLMRRGATLTEATATLCERLNLNARVLPMSDAPVRTRFITDAGELSFQEYFVRERLRPRLVTVRFEGIESAKASPEVVSALGDAELIVIGPSNPMISVAPILQLVGLHMNRARSVAVTPIVGGAALKGPTVEMMRALGVEPGPLEVARLYREVAGTFVLDERDRAIAGEIEGLDYRVLFCDTVMKDGGRVLAEALLARV